MHTSYNSKALWVLLELENNKFHQDIIDQCLDGELIEDNPIMELKCYDTEDTPTIPQKNDNQPYFRKFEKKKFK
jgi:hypothetical protein